MNIDGNLLAEFIDYQTSVIVALLPLFSAVVGVFVAFAIANSLRFFILKLIKR